jgi:hypothetical protein
MELYVTSDRVRQLVKTLSDQGIEVFMEDYKLQVLLSDGSYRKVTILDLPTTNELAFFLIQENEKVK